MNLISNLILPKTFATFSTNLCSFNSFGFLKNSLQLVTSIRNLKEPAYPPLNETEIREIYTKGSGPGGQKVNKATNRCELKHLPTGIVVSSHDTRSLEDNRKIARKLLQRKLDFHYNKEESYLAKLQKQKQQERYEKNRRAVLRLEKKKILKEKLLEQE